MENSFIREWKYFLRLFSKDYFAISGEMSYRPLVTISYFIDYAIWEMNPFGYHLTNVTLHVGNTALFYLFLHTCVRNKKICLLALLFFITHPVLLETVNAVGYREDLLAASFILVSLVYFLKSDKILEREDSQKKRLVFFYTISLVSYFCALFSKESAVIFTALLPLFVLFSDKKILPALVRRLKGIYIGYIGITLFYLIIRFVVLINPSLKAIYQPGGFWVNFFTMIKILASYIKLSFFPFRLNVDYVVPLANTPLEGSSIISILFLISVLVIFGLLCKSRHVFACWMAWFFITILPVMNIVPLANIMAERYLYLPVMGFCVAKGILIYRITDRTLSTRAMPLRRVVQLVLVIYMVGMYGVSIIRTNGDWRDEFTLWTKTASHSPKSNRAHCNLGIVYMENGFLERAQKEYQIALDINPEDAIVHRNLGSLFAKKGLEDQAFIEYGKAIQFADDDPKPHNNLGNIYFNRGQIDEAQLEYEKALKIKPDYSIAHNGLGTIYDRKGLHDKAVEEFKTALYYDDAYLPARINLGVNYAKRGLLDEAIVEFKKVVETDEKQIQGHFNLALAYEKSGKQREAVREFTLVVQLDPNNFNAHYALGTLYQKMQMIDNAIDAYQKVLMLNPRFTQGYKSLAVLYLYGKKDSEKARYYLEKLFQIDPSQSQKEEVGKIVEQLQSARN
ncbi:MAG: tetratricopeptide repeat protein [Candidatus Brocadiaceae bacterium]|nr:tetratricopeptide repeat protein [Candidatus Brocadiaceae bacterium]